MPLHVLKGAVYPLAADFHRAETVLKAGKSEQKSVSAAAHIAENKVGAFKALAPDGAHYVDIGLHFMHAVSVCARRANGIQALRSVAKRAAEGEKPPAVGYIIAHMRILSAYKHTAFFAGGKIHTHVVAEGAHAVDGPIADGVGFESIVFIAGIAQTGGYAVRPKLSQVRKKRRGAAVQSKFPVQHLRVPLISLLRKV